MKPTVILVHGAYADSSSWSDVIPALLTGGHRVVAWANPLRGVAADAATLSDLVYSLDGPVVLVGYSYGGAVITNVDPDAGDVVALVFVAGFALEAGRAPATRPRSHRARHLRRRWTGFRSRAGAWTPTSRPRSSTISSPLTCPLRRVR